MFKQSKNDNIGNSKSISTISGDNIDKKKDDKLLFEDFKDENSDDDEKENIVTYEGYLIKVVEKKMRKIWFKLVGKDLFFFKDDKDELHK